MPQLIFLTGASGFLGSHIATQLLDNGYSVRATARGRRIEELKKSYAKFGDRFQVVDVLDLATDQFPEALEGVDGLIHTAAPLADRAEPEEIFKATVAISSFCDFSSMSYVQGAVNGTLNVVRQAQKAGITRIVVTSSIVTVSTLINANPALFTDQGELRFGLEGNQTRMLDEGRETRTTFYSHQFEALRKYWYHVDPDKVLEGTKWDVYCAGRTLAERELWAFSAAHPELEITTINPPFLYGPFPEGFTQPTPDYYRLSTNIQLYRFLKPSSRFPPFPGYADVRDCAKAHILGLNSPPTSAVGRKRVVFCSPHGYDFTEILQLLAEKRPELKDRLNKEPPPKFTFDRAPIDFARIEQLVGIKKEDFKPREVTFLDAVDGLLAFEKQWAALGHELDIPDN
ncbi:hypothetical protein D9615_009866 [Tricholomella constricta]|uniref:NAD(P)-binding domain-containing protein n=1 Tax=Tricholomella constricta TaxID=117010 RepID=A0A8H5GX10_9AGAR|nr:hypothetical protein D9615_009866 [Tricholomella constricta]